RRGDAPARWPPVRRRAGKRTPAPRQWEPRGWDGRSSSHGGRPLDGSVKRDYLRAMRRPSVIAHRGASGYEYENSRAAFRRAVMLDADGVELDIHATRDGAIVVHHDPDVQGCGPIALLTLAEARQVRLPNGETLPLLQAVLDLVGDNDVGVEVKSLLPVHERAL